MSSIQSRNILLRFPCSLKTDAKKRRPSWQLVRATCSVYEAGSVSTSSQSVSPPMGKWPSEGDRLQWPWASMSHWLHVPSTRQSYSRKCISSPLRQGDSSSCSPCLKCFPTWHLSTPTAPLPHSEEQKLKCHLSQFPSDHSEPELLALKRMLHCLCCEHEANLARYKC